MNRLARCVLASALATSACAAQGGTPVVTCVDTVQALSSIAGLLGQNGEDDDLRLVAGTYKPDARISIVVQESNRLLISGGWNANCTVQDGGATVFDGQGTSLLLNLVSPQDASLGVTDITFVNAAATSNQGLGGALAVYTSGLALVERDLFLANRYPFGAPALAMAGRQATVARNNLFVANTSSNDHPVAKFGCSAVPGSTLTVVGNTVVGNQADGADAIGGLETDCADGTAYVVNNLLWNNAGADLRIVGPGHAILYNNDIGVLGGDAPNAQSERNFSAAPIFRPGILNFGQAASSPTINRGRDCVVPAMGCQLGLGETDLNGMPRIQGAHVDVGAYESDVVFYGDFETVP